MMSRPMELRTRPYTPSSRYWPRPGTTASRRVTASITTARTMTVSTITIIVPVIAKAPSPNSGCQKSGALGGTKVSSAAETMDVTTQPPSGAAAGGCVPAARTAVARHLRRTCTSRAVHTVTDPDHRDRGGHAQDERDRQHPDPAEGLADPPGRQSEDEHGRHQGAQGVPSLAQVFTRDHLGVHGRRAALVAVRHRWAPA